LPSLAWDSTTTADLSVPLEKSKLRIAITGARGRLACGLLMHLRKIGHCVTPFSTTGDAHLRNTISLTSSSQLKEFDVLLHLGWSSVPLLSERCPGIEDQSDLPLLNAITEAALRCDRPPKIVFFSTAAVYGNTSHLPATEETDCNPLGRYASAKLRAEKILLGYENTCILRVTNVFGTSTSPARPQGIIPFLLTAARNNSEVTIWGDGMATKDYLAASDLHDAVASVVACDLRGVFNVASGNSLPVLQLVSALEHNFGGKIKVRHLPQYDWDVTLSFISPQKLNSATGWKAVVSLQDWIGRLDV
jgi:nucleoside-diphosphate-sugar epimerase